MKKILYTLFLILPSITQGQTTRVLFIGNSYTSVNNLPSLVKSVALSLGDTMYIDSNAPGGYTFQQQSVNSVTLGKIAQGNWDFVILQAQSQEPSFPPSQVQSQTYPYAKNLCDSIRHYNNCTEPVFYMTWGRQNGDASNCASYPVVCTYEGMQMRLRQSYLEMALSNHTTIAPVGVVWKKVRNTDSTINLYNADQSHPSLWGSYLAACVIYTTLYNKPSQGAWVPPSLNLDTALFIQNIASTLVQDSISKWYLGNLQAASFTSSVSGYNISVTDHSINPGTVNWNFGDGFTGEGLTVQHTYMDSGWFTVTHTITNDCFSKTSTENVYIAYQQPSSIIMPNQTLTLLTFDNYFIIQSSEKIADISITNVLGQTEYYSINQSQWQSTKLQKGLYLLTLKNENGEVRIKKVLLN